MVPEKLYKIGEVMKYSGLSRQVIHNYTQIGLINLDGQSFLADPSPRFMYLWMP